MKRPLFCTLLGLIATAGSCHGGLEWRTRTIEQNAPLDAKEVTATFEFVNTGKTPIVLEEIKPFCGCTSATSEKECYAPGEKGAIKAVFNIGSRTGLQTKEIFVKLKDDPGMTELKMITHIPDVMHIAPQFIYWRVGDKPDPKTINIRIEEGIKVEVKEVLTSDPRVKPTLKEVTPAKEYQLVITPGQTQEPTMAAVTLRTVVDGKTPKDFAVYAHVKPAAEIPR